MTPATHLIDIAAVEALLSRLDPEPQVCQVPGCLHQHEEPDRAGELPALAA